MAEQVGGLAGLAVLHQRVWDCALGARPVAQMGRDPDPFGRTFVVALEKKPRHRWLGNWLANTVGNESWLSFN